jgi:esterase
MPLMLSHSVTGDRRADRTAFVLHGILGSLRNWRSFARRLAAACPGWRLVLVDLRGHGDSHPATPPNTVAAAAADLARLAEHLGLRPELVVGHSFGGKVAMAYGRDFPRGLEQVWVLDALPGADARGEALSGEVARVIAGLRAIALPLPGREALAQRLLADGFSEVLARWMTTNLTRGEGGLVWRFDLDAVEQLLADYLREDLTPWLEDPWRGPEVHFVRAARSERWSDALAEELALNDRVAVHLLADSGHWVHAENPEGLLEILAPAFR